MISKEPQQPRYFSIFYSCKNRARNFKVVESRGIAGLCAFIAPLLVCHNTVHRVLSETLSLSAIVLYERKPLVFSLYVYSASASGGIAV